MSQCLKGGPPYRFGNPHFEWVLKQFASCNNGSYRVSTGLAGVSVLPIDGMKGCACWYADTYMAANQQHWARNRLGQPFRDIGL